MKDLDKYLIENKEVDHTEVPGTLGGWLFKNKPAKVFDMGSTYQIRRLKKIGVRDMDVLLMHGLISIEGAGGSSLVITIRK